MAVEIEWTARFMGQFAETPDAIKKQVTILPGSWADCKENAETACQECLADYFNYAADWSEFFGDDDCATIVMSISAPADVIGRYRVALKRVIKADAVRMEPA